MEKINIFLDKVLKLTPIIILLIMIVCYITCYYTTLYQLKSFKTNEIEIIEKIDTIRDTIIIDQPKLITKTKIKTITDTLHVQGALDTVKVAVDVPIETKEYKDSSYYVRISGFQPFLEHLEVYPVQITKERIVTQQRAIPEHRWGLGVNGGYSYDIRNNKFIPTIGIGVQYNIFNW